MTLVSVGSSGRRDGTAVFLHGWGADEHDLTSLASYLPAGLAWESVRAPLRHPAFGYAWYPLESDDSWDDEPAIGSATEALWDWVDETLGSEAHIVPIGFSQGGLMASQLLRTRPARVRATAILSGYVRTGDEVADGTLATSLPPVFWGRGSADAVIPPRAVESTEVFLGSHATLTRHVYEGLGHSVSERELDHLRAFLDGALAA